MVQAAWLELEARHQRLTVTAREVSRSFVAQKRESFETDAKYQAFLRESGMPQADILLPVRQDLLSQKLPAKIPPSRLGAFVTAFQARWKRQTACAPQFYVAASCSRSL